MKNKYSPLTQEFINWFHSRGEFYRKLSVHFYMDGEPYFSSMGAECSLRDYLQAKEDDNLKLPNNQQDRDMIARELLVKFQMSPKHPLVDLKKAYLKF